MTGLYIRYFGNPCSRGSCPYLASPAEGLLPGKLALQFLPFEPDPIHNRTAGLENNLEKPK